LKTKDFDRIYLEKSFSIVCPFCRADKKPVKIKARGKLLFRIAFFAHLRDEHRQLVEDQVFLWNKPRD
jgi:hypothetical protein